jgi:transcriptional regulator with XRE-family HTH domain
MLKIVYIVSIGVQMDKRDLVRRFHERLTVLVDRHGGNLARLAKATGVDRAALRQLLDPESTRLPRAETLCRLADAAGVSLDWLVGRSQSEDSVAEIVRAIEIEPTLGEVDDDRLAAWHREAEGYKIRYVPATVPDLLKHEVLTRYEFVAESADVDTKRTQARRQLAYSRLPETDLEACMPVQTLRGIARGEGIWEGLSPDERRTQLCYMADLLSELYPTFRLFLFDGRTSYAAPYTVFGPLRAVLYLGRRYLVINSVEHIRELARHFDDLIRLALISPDRAEFFIREHLINVRRP